MIKRFDHLTIVVNDGLWFIVAAQISHIGAMSKSSTPVTLLKLVIVFWSNRVQAKRAR